MPYQERLVARLARDSQSVPLGSLNSMAGSRGSEPQVSGSPSARTGIADERDYCWALCTRWSMPLTKNSVIRPGKAAIAIVPQRRLG